MKIKEVKIQSEFIRLDDLLKYEGVVSTGGYAKFVIQGGEVRVNGDICLQRGKKLRPGDKIEYAGDAFQIV